VARRGSFGTGTSPFARAARYSDLSAYRIGGTQGTVSPTYIYYGGGAPSGPPAAYTAALAQNGAAGWAVTIGEGGKMTYAPPPKPTVAPPATSFYGSLVLPVPTLPEAMVPGVSYVPEETFGQQWQGER
jgi:hypothetical protein